MLFILLNTALNAQNGDFDYISNGSFEAYDSCPPNTSTEFDRFFNVCNDWWIPYYGTSDYFNECFNSNPYNYSQPFFPFVGTPNNFFGYQEPYEGKAYIGIFLNAYLWRYYREYVQTELKQPLEQNHRYRLRMYFSRANNSWFAMKNTGAVFTENKIVDYEKVVVQNEEAATFPEFIQDTLNWILVDLIYKAKGGEKFLTIGQFTDTLDTENIKDLVNDSLTDMRAYIFIDSVSIKQTYNAVIPNVLTPNGDGINDIVTLIIPPSWTDIQFSIYNRWGEATFNKSDEYTIEWAPPDSRNTQNNGVYFYVFSYLNELNQKETQKGFIQVLTSNY